MEQRRWDVKVEARQRAEGKQGKGGAFGGGNNLPVDSKASGASRSDTKTTFSLALEPSLRPLVISQVRLESLKASAIVILYPLLLVLGEHTILNHLGLDGDTGKPLEAEPAVTVELVFGLDPSDDECGFETDTPLSWRV
jgi:hypothetical protein